MNVASTADVVDRVHDAAARGTPLRIAAGGTWMDAGAPCDAGERLELRALSGIVDYEPGDLTLTARAATPLDALRRATAAHGQWLPLEPFGDARGTIGATMATASYGPLASAYGTPRNQVLGCELVTGAGDVVRAGGRVVKNVAGFDITRLMVGAWGTLGAITEVTVRLRARPEADVTIAIAVGDAGGVERAPRWLRTSEFTPLAAELVSPALAARLSLPTANASVLLLRLGGNEASVRAARHAVGALGDATEPGDAVWERLAGIEAVLGRSATLRLSGAPAGMAELWTTTLDVIEAVGGLAHATVARGVVRCVLPAPDDASVARLRGMLTQLPRATRVVERFPAAPWPARRADDITRRLSAGIRGVFDGNSIFNPGIMGTA